MLRYGHIDDGGPCATKVAIRDGLVVRNGILRLRSVAVAALIQILVGGGSRWRRLRHRAENVVWTHDMDACLRLLACGRPLKVGSATAVLRNAGPSLGGTSTFCCRFQKDKIHTNGSEKWSPGLIFGATCIIF